MKTTHSFIYKGIMTPCNILAENSRVNIGTGLRNIFFTVSTEHFGIIRCVSAVIKT